MNCRAGNQHCECLRENESASSYLSRTDRGLSAQTPKIEDLALKVAMYIPPHRRSSAERAWQSERKYRSTPWNVNFDDTSPRTCMFRYSPTKTSPGMRHITDGKSWRRTPIQGAIQQPLENTEVQRQQLAVYHPPKTSYIKHGNNTMIQEDEEMVRNRSEDGTLDSERWSSFAGVDRRHGRVEAEGRLIIQYMKRMIYGGFIRRMKAMSRSKQF